MHVDYESLANVIIVILIILLMATVFLIWRIIVHRGELKRAMRQINGVYYDNNLRLYTSTYNDCLISFRSKKNNDIESMGIIAERSGLYDRYPPGSIYFYDRRMKKLYVNTSCPSVHQTLNFKYVRELRDSHGRLAMIKLSHGTELSFSYDHMIV